MSPTETDDGAIQGRVERAVLQSLRAITTAGGYHASPVVEAGPESSMVAGPTVSVETDAATDPLPAQAALSTSVGQREWSLVVRINCRVPPPGGADGVRRVLDLASDVRRRLAEDSSLDGSALEIYEMEADEWDDAMVRGDGSARLVYRARVVTLADAVEEKSP